MDFKINEAGEKNNNNVLYVFGGEKAQGAEIVLDRLMSFNLASVKPHLFISPGTFAEKLIAEKRPYKISLITELKKLNRATSSSLTFYLKAIKNYFVVSYKAQKYIKKHKISVIHANTIVPASYLLPLIWYSRLFNKRLKWIWSDHDLSYFSKLDHILSNHCLKSYDRTLVVSCAVKRKYQESDKVMVLYNGIDLDLFKPDLSSRYKFRKGFKLGEEVIIIGMPAVVNPRKGQLQLIEAFENVSKVYPNTRLYFAGGFESATLQYATAVKSSISQNNRISHLGYMDNMSDFYNGCDIIVNNSNLSGSEPLGTTIYEAMAFKKVVVAANTGGTPEIITDLSDGFLFEPENLGKLEDILNSVLKDFANLEPLKSAARRTASQKFNIVNMVANYNRIIAPNATSNNQK